MVYGGSNARDLEGEIAKVMDDALETLRWARLHYHEPKASETLRELEAKLGYLAQAMSWQADGARQRQTRRWAWRRGARYGSRTRPADVGRDVVVALGQVAAPAGRQRADDLHACTRTRMPQASTCGDPLPAARTEH